MTSFSNHPDLNLPPVLKEIQSLSMSETDADIILLSSITAISAVLPHYYGNYGSRDHYPNLYLFVSASASTGKGRIDIARQLVTPIHNALRKKSEMIRKERIAEAEAAGKAAPECFPNYMLFTPANTSSTALYQTMKENQSSSLLFETEADTLSQTLKSDISNFSDGLRKAFHHEVISYLRRANNEYAELTSPRLSVVLAGTPQQVLRLIPDTENGLFSRFMIYNAPTNLQWANIFSQEQKSLNKKLPLIAQKIYCLHQMFNQLDHTIEFSFTPEQENRFNEIFANMQNELYAQLGDSILASVRRLGLITFRIAMILTALRLCGEQCQPLPHQLFCTDDDFRNAIIITQCVIEHILYTFVDIPDSSSKPEMLPYEIQRINSLLELLPQKFCGNDILRVKKEMHISSKTAYKYIKHLTEENRVRKIARGTYEKTEIIND